MASPTFAPDVFLVRMPSGDFVNMTQRDIDAIKTRQTDISSLFANLPQDKRKYLKEEDIQAFLDYSASAQPTENKPVGSNTPQGQQAIQDVMEAGKPTGPRSDKKAVPKTELATLIAREAERIGADPVELATVISYETAGTFDPAQPGPITEKWGQHMGLIQMGGPQREQYGYDLKGSLDSQMKAVGDYLIDRGYKPGMNIYNLYSTINAGNPNRLGAKDEAAGGAPGTVKEKVDTQMSGHKEKAINLFDFGDVNGN